MQIQLYTITCTTYLWTCSHAGETRPSYNYKSYKDHFTHADYLGGRGWLDDSEFACNNRYLDAIPNSEAYCSDQYVSKTFEAPVSVVFLGLNEHQFWHTSIISPHICNFQATMADVWREYRWIGLYLESGTS